MTRTRHDTSPQAQAIRAAGFVRVPGGLWATQEQLELILYMLQQNLETINKIKDRYDGTTTSSHY
jgi:phosphoglucomutase